MASCGDNSEGHSNQGGQQSEAFEDLSYDEHLRCAALISAYNGLANSSVVKPDPERDPRQLETMAWHINAYAVPQDIREDDAFLALKRLREELVATQSSQEILDEARICMDVVE